MPTFTAPSGIPAGRGDRGLGNLLQTRLCLSAPPPRRMPASHTLVLLRVKTSYRSQFPVGCPLPGKLGENDDGNESPILTGSVSGSQGSGAPVDPPDAGRVVIVAFAPRSVHASDPNR